MKTTAYEPITRKPVVIDYAQTVQCNQCYGSGLTPFYEDDCSNCNGLGRITKLSPEYALAILGEEMAKRIFGIERKNQ